MLQGNKVFNSRFINKIKNPSTNKAFKKLKLVIQVYNNLKKPHTNGIIYDLISQLIFYSLYYSCNLK